MSHTLDAALAGSDATNADGPTAVKTYASVVASTVVATGTINNTLFIYPLIQIVVAGASGGWANIKPGMDVLIGTTAGASDIGIYRVKSSDTNLLYIGESGPGDSGFLTVGLRTTSFAVGQNLTIVNRYSPWSVLPLINQGVIYEDYGVLVTDFPANWNLHPPPLVYVKCASTNRTEWNHIACFVDDGQVYATIVFTASVTLWPTSASAAYAWTAPGSWTVTAGATNTATFTAQVPSSATNYVLELAVTENGGNIAKRHIMVWVHDRSGSKAPLTVSGLSGDSWDRTGAKLTFMLNNNLLASFPDGAMVCIWQEATFNGATILSAVDQFVGWIVRINKRVDPGLRTAEPEFVGPAGIMDFKRGTSQIWDVTAGTPANWEELPASLMSLSFAKFWVLSQRARGILELFDFIPYSTDATGQRLPEIMISPGQIWSQLTSIADGIAKRNIGADPDGTLWVQPHPSLIDYSSRSSIVKRDTLTAARYHAVDWPREMFDKVGLVEGEAFTWDGAATLPTPILSLALSTSMGQGGNDQKLQNQVVADQASLNILTGNYYRLLNPDYQDITVNIYGNRGALYKPAQMAMVRLQIPQNLTPEDVAFDRYMIPREVRRSYSQSTYGSILVDTALVCEVETAGVAGTTKQVPAANASLYADTTILTTPPALQDTQTAFGPQTSFVPTRILWLQAEGHVARGTPLVASPTWTDISMSSGNIDTMCGGSGGTGYVAFPGLTATYAYEMAILDATQNPFNANEVIILGSKAIAVLTNPFSGSASYAIKSISPTAGYCWGYYGGTDGFNKNGKIEGSINVSGYFGWTEFPESASGHIYYCYTTDNFASYTRVDTGLTWTFSLLDQGVSHTIGCFASAKSNINIWLNVSGSVVRSQNGGDTWSAYTYTVSHVAEGSLRLNMPFSKPGGGNNTSYLSMVAKDGWGGASDGHLWIKGVTGTEFALPNTGSYLSSTPRMIQTLTIDSNYIAMYDGARFHFSTDGVNFTTTGAPGGGNPVFAGLNGWPTNPNFWVVFCSQNCGFTIDGGASFTTFVQPSFGGGACCIFADFSEVYSTGGVHP